MLSQDLPLDSNASKKWVLSSLGHTGSVKVMTQELLVCEEDEGGKISDFLKHLFMLWYKVLILFRQPFCNFVRNYYCPGQPLAQPFSFHITKNIQS